MNVYNLRYSIITAVKNEEYYILRTIESVIHQTILPVEWIIINDGSEDKTKELIEIYQEKINWITKIDIYNYKEHIRSTGGRVGHLMNIALKALTKDYDFIVKLDGDVEFENNFFFMLLNQFILNNKLGIASGNLIFNNKIEKVNYDDQITRGAVMIIRKDLLKNIKGFFESKGRGEDRLFAVAARYFGWETKTFPVFFKHLKPEGCRHSFFHEAYITGFYKGSIPYKLDYFILTLFKHSLKKPYIIGPFLQVSGYIYSRYLINYRPFPFFIKAQLHQEQGQIVKNFFRKFFISS